MAWVAGADGCKGGWFRTSINVETGKLHFDLIGEVEGLLGTNPRPELLAVDIPIGLPDTGRRNCDRAAREWLGPRRNSVFRAPIRPAICARTREDASRITRECDRCGVGAQSWGIYKKVHEMDRWLRLDDAARQSVREVHPEVSFCAWAGRPMCHHKATPEGRAERLTLVTEWLGEGTFEAARAICLRKHAQDDDILDAIAALWTAARILSGAARTLPDKPGQDAAGLPMEIVY